MASKKKQNKLKNSYFYKTALKNKFTRLKRYLFFTSSERKMYKQQLRKELAGA